MQCQFLIAVRQGVAGHTDLHDIVVELGDLGPPLANLASQQLRMSASGKDRIGIVVDHDAVFAPEQDNRHWRMEQYADRGFQALRPGFDRTKRFRPVMTRYQLCRATAACKERRNMASPDHVGLYLATSTMTSQFHGTKLRENAEVPHVVRIEEGRDAPDDWNGAKFKGNALRVQPKACNRVNGLVSGHQVRAGLRYRITTPLRWCGVVEGSLPAKIWQSPARLSLGARHLVRHGKQRISDSTGSGSSPGSLNDGAKSWSRATDRQRQWGRRWILRRWPYDVGQLQSLRNDPASRTHV